MSPAVDLRLAIWPSCLGYLKQDETSSILSRCLKQDKTSSISQESREIWWSWPFQTNWLDGFFYFKWSRTKLWTKRRSKETRMVKICSPAGACWWHRMYMQLFQRKLDDFETLHCELLFYILKLESLSFSYQYMTNKMLPTFIRMHSFVKIKWI